MPVYKLLPQAQPYGYPVGILLLDLVETHVPGDTAHTATYDYPVLFKVVSEATVDRVTHGDRAVEAALVAAARELERAGVKAISTNCGFMIHYQEAVRAAVNIPVFLSSLLQLPMIARTIRPEQTIGIMTAFQSIAASKNTSLAVVAPGIAEALLATAIGLLAAIPAVIAYNKLSSDAGKINGKLEGFADEFSAILSRQIDEKLSARN